MTVSERRARERETRHRLIIDQARALAETEGWDAVTTRRLSTVIQYSQPVLYSHFRNREAIIAAVATEGFAELAEIVDGIRDGAPDHRSGLAAALRAYLDFAEGHPAVYEVMFSRAVSLPFAQEDTPEQLRAAFASIVALVEPHAGDHDVDTFAEVVWAAAHGLACLARDRRLRPHEREQRITVLVERLTR